MASETPVAAVILAAGLGKRMKSTKPKVSFEICGRPMVRHVAEAVRACGVERIVVVVGHGREVVEKGLAGVPGVSFALQAEQKGTGDAAKAALPALEGFEGAVLLLCGDVPLVRRETLDALLAAHRASGAAATVLSVVLPEGGAYGRIVRDGAGAFVAIRESKDASDAERAIREINSGLYVFDAAALRSALPRVGNANAQGEYYLTDVVSVLRDAGHPVLGIEAADAMETVGVNDRAQLATAEAALRARLNERWMREGVSMTDPATTYVDADVELAPDVTLLPGTILQGRTVVHAHAVVGPHSQLVDTVVGEKAVVRQTVARGAEIGEGATVGPFVSLRPGTVLARGAHVGTFVETKNALIHEGAKVPHLSYVGDAEIGAGANIGAGTITANYDGTRKHRTKVGEGVRTGSNSVLVAPVELGAGAYTGAGAVVTGDVPPGALAIGVPAKIREGWASRRDHAPREDEGSGDDEGRTAGGD